MTKPHHLTPGFGMIGWQEIVILLACPGLIVCITCVVLLILYLTGVIGGKRNH